MLFKVQNIFWVINAKTFLKNVIFKPKNLKSMFKFIIKECYNSQVIAFASLYKNLILRRKPLKIAIRSRIKIPNFEAAELE